jgi:uncharacterized protein (TIGR03437 family)
VTLAVAVAPASNVTGVTVAPDKTSVPLAAGASTTLTINLSGSVPAAGQYSGAVTLSATGVSVRVPYMFIIPSGTAFNANIFGGFFGTPGQDGKNICMVGCAIVQVVDRFGAPVAGTPVVFSVLPRNALTFQSVSGEPNCTAAATTATCNTDSYGFAYVSAVLGSAATSATVTARPTAISGVNLATSAFVLVAPAVDSTQVFNAADYGTTVAPGSFMGLKGSNLVDTDFLSNSGFDLATTAQLPLVLDNVSVSFDVPSKGISVPASMYYVSSGQLNVVVPWELQGQTSAQMKVIVDQGIVSNLVNVTLSDYAPAFFADSNTGIVAAVDLQGVQIFTNHSAVQGQPLQLYANGLGPVRNQPASGAPSPTSPPFADTTTTPVVMIGGKQAQVLYAGLAPGNAAEFQINVVVPTGLTPGNQQVTVAIGGKTSKAGVLPVQ